VSSGCFGSESLDSQNVVDLNPINLILLSLRGFKPGEGFVVGSDQGPMIHQVPKAGPSECPKEERGNFVRCSGTSVLRL
jgi:hypothetical protein